MEKSHKNDGSIMGAAVALYDLKLFVTGSFLLYSKIASQVNHKKGDRVLDVGCGTGAVLGLLARRAQSEVFFFGIDSSADMIELAKKKTKEKKRTVDFKVASANKLPFPNDYFDWVVSSLATHHMDISTREGMFQEVYRVLKKGGKFLISDYYKPQGWLGICIEHLLLNHHSHAKDLIKLPNEELVFKSGFKKKYVLYAPPVQHLCVVK